MQTLALQKSESVEAFSDASSRACLFRLFNQTAIYLDSLGRAASEGRAVDEANNFVRWLQFSGVLRLLEVNAEIDPKFLTLRPKSEGVLAQCRPFLQGHNVKLPPSLARVDEANDKLDFILSIIAKHVTPPVPLQITEIGVVHHE